MTVRYSSGDHTRRPLLISMLLHAGREHDDASEGFSVVELRIGSEGREGIIVAMLADN